MVGLPGGLDVLAVLACHLTYVSIINTLGTEAAAAHGLGVQIEALSYSPASSFAVAAATLTGQYLGAGDLRLAGRVVRTAAALGVSFMTMMGVLFSTCGRALVGIFVAPGAEVTAALATDYLGIVAWSMPFLALAMILSCALRGAGDTVWTLVITFTGLALIRVPGAAWLAWSDWTVPGLGWQLHGWALGVYGAWAAMVIDVADIQPPDLETCLAILRTKADRAGRHVPNEILELIAERVQSNIRELEGALNPIVAFADLSGGLLTPDLVEVALADLLPQKQNISPAKIMEVVASRSGLDLDDLIGQNRTAKIAIPRQLAMYLLREKNKISYPQIGELLGGRDHTTIMYGIRKVEEDEKLRKQAESIWREINQPMTV